ncbi:hypothetical protein J0910_11855 [Nocardiopsis sp. CNT-189]|uniref:hypothetical protein n=1 Tax=Nocardiopsis oceanisediminis TaxID=2816862 RepID=UPI003B38AC05
MTATGPGTGTRHTARDDPSLLTVIALELGRLRRGFPFWMALLLPLVLVMPLGLIAAFSPEGKGGDVWGVWFSVTLLFWGVFQPMGCALYSAMSIRADRDARRLLYGYAFPRHRLLTAKYCALLAVGLASALLLALLLAAAAAALGGASAVAEVPGGVLIPWVAGAGTLALCLFTAEKWGFPVTAAIGVVGMVLAGTVADQPFWWAVPPVWPMRAVVPLAGIEASGVPLAPGDPLASTGVLPLVIALSAGLAAVLVAVAARHVNRKELS